MVWRACINIKYLNVFRDLRCLRNTIHTNLMCTYILSDFTWILTSTLQVCEQFTKKKFTSVVFLIFCTKLFIINNLTSQKSLTGPILQYLLSYNTQKCV